MAIVGPIAAILAGVEDAFFLENDAAPVGVVAFLSDLYPYSFSRFDALG
jgi:hypothetical protein